MGSGEDIQDMLAFQRGDEMGFHRLFQRYSRPIMNYLYRFIWNRSVAEELTQEVFLRVCRAAKTYEPRTAFRTWLYQIATNVGRNEIRKHVYSVREESMEHARSWESRNHTETAPDSRSDSPEGLAVAKRLGEEIHEILSRLPERQRMAVLLSRHHGFSYQEIAGIMQLRVGAVKSLIHRATETLREQLAYYMETGLGEGEKECDVKP